MDTGYDGLGLGLGNLARLSAAETRSISAENPTGAKGAGGQATEGTGAVCARELGQGWKISPSINLPGNTTVTLADVDGPGAIQQIWLTLHPTFWRRVVLRIYWDDETTPSVETPIGDFFCNGWGVRSNVTSLPVAVNPAGGFNCYWEMPFRKHARITVENVSPDTLNGFYYQINYTLTEIPADRAYFHAQWRRSNPLPYGEVHTLLDGVQGQGHYVGTYLAWGVNNNGWWGEGEIKFYIDGDNPWPTICGTGTEDYFGGAWGFFKHPTKDPVEQAFNAPFYGMSLAHTGSADGPRYFSLYRWHILDSIGFAQDLKVTVQALGWWPGSQYEPLTDDIASVAFWYQTEPHGPFPALPGLSELEVI